MIGVHVPWTGRVTRILIDEVIMTVGLGDTLRHNLAENGCFKFSFFNNNVILLIMIFMSLLAIFLLVDFSLLQI